MQLSVVHTLVYQAALVMTPIGAGVAIVKGGKAERYGALFFLATLLSTDLVLWIILPRLGVESANSLPIVDMISTFLISSFFLYLAVRYASLWLAAAMVVQGTELYFARAYIDVGKPGLYDYGLQLNLICLSVLSLLLFAAIVSWRARVTGRRQDAVRAELAARRREDQQRKFEDMLATRAKPMPAPKPAPGRVARLIIEPPPA